MEGSLVERRRVDGRADEDIRIKKGLLSDRHRHTYPRAATANCRAMVQHGEVADRAAGVLVWPPM